MSQVPGSVDVLLAPVEEEEEEPFEPNNVVKANPSQQLNPVTQPQPCHYTKFWPLDPKAVSWSD